MANKTVKVSELLPLAHMALAEKWGYIWGGYGQIHTQAAQNKAARAQTKKWGQRWVGKHVLDCSGLFYWSYKKMGGYMYHGCNKVWRNYSVKKGTLKNGKPTDGTELKPGYAVFLTTGEDRHHMGMYIGGGMVIEAKGTYYGVVRSSVKVWDEWAELITTDYDVTEEDHASYYVEPVPDTASNGSVVKTVKVTLQQLSNGSRGEQVKTMQILLNAAGNDCGTPDGDFGSNTDAAVKAFQTAKGLTVDGICGGNTWGALLGA